ncbi:MAG: hypothetical protein Q4C45_05965, partial [Oscillospiraceae bacterium]|nr:hypothetical protein [Oscillospiraceae bacterium]
MSTASTTSPPADQMQVCLPSDSPGQKRIAGNWMQQIPAAQSAERRRQAMDWQKLRGAEQCGQAQPDLAAQIGDALPEKCADEKNRRGWAEENIEQTEDGAGLFQKCRGQFHDGCLLFPGNTKKQGAFAFGASPLFRGERKLAGLSGQLG